MNDINHVTLCPLARPVPNGWNGRKQVDVLPPQTRNLSQPRASVERRQDQSAPVAFRDLHECGNLLRRERLLSLRGIGQRLDRGAWVDADVSLLVCSIEGAR